MLLHNTMLLARISRRLHQIYDTRSPFFQSHLQYSIAPAAAKPQTGSLEEFLINSLGFSKEEAISASNKVIPRLKPIKKDLNLVVNFFENLGLNKIQVKSVISTAPELLFCKIDKTLQPKIQVLQDLGLSGSGLVNVIMVHKTLLRKGLDSCIKPRIEYLRKLLGTDAKVALAVKRCSLVLDPGVFQSLARNVSLLRKIGFSDGNVAKFIVRNPRQILINKDGLFEDVAHRLENDIGIPRDSPMFYYGVEVFYNYQNSTIDKKFDLFRSFGWSDTDILKLVRIHPFILAASEAKLGETLNFLMKELGYTSDILASCNTFFTVNLEKRVKLRYEVLKVLNQRKLNKRKAGLYSVIRFSESDFLKNYVLPYKDKIPDVCTSYIEGIQK